MREIEKCPICEGKVNVEKVNAKFPTFDIDCPICGNYTITQSDLSTLDGVSDKSNNYLLSAYLREVNSFPVVSGARELDSFIKNINRPQDIFQQIDRLLLYIVKRQSYSGEMIKINYYVDYPIIYGKNIREFVYVLEKALELDFIETEIAIEEHPDQYMENNIRPNLNGWKRIEELKQTAVYNNQAFVAMWFDEKMNDAYNNGIHPALEETGYKPFRIDMKEHNNKIDDEIIANIRRSGLLVADFTGHRGGVYFEAGYAMGLGIPIIWTCREDDIKKCHFDTRQYNHILWSTPEKLKEKLINRIEATIPGHLRKQES